MRISSFGHRFAVDVNFLTWLVVSKSLSIFVSNWLWESIFSLMKIFTTKIRSLICEINLQSYTRIKWEAKNLVAFGNLHSYTLLVLSYYVIDSLFALICNISNADFINNEVIFDISKLGVLNFSPVLINLCMIEVCSHNFSLNYDQKTSPFKHSK